MSKVYAKALDEYTTKLIAAMPADIRKLRARITNDLYGGPTYYDADDNEVTCFDEGAKAFPFVSAVKKVRDWIHENWPSTVWYNDSMGEISEYEPKCQCEEDTNGDDPEDNWAETTYCHCLEEWCEVSLEELIDNAFDRETVHYLK